MIDSYPESAIGIVPKFHRYFIGIFAGVMLLGGQLQASSMIGPWLEMAEVCETVMVEQNADSLKNYRKAPLQLNVEGMVELAVVHNNGELYLSAAFDDFEWFLCTIRSAEAVSSENLAELIDNWSAAQFAVGKRNGHALIDLGGDHFAPVRVRCLDNDRITVVFAFLAQGSRDFRVGVTNRLPNGVASPCGGGGSQDNA